MQIVELEESTSQTDYTPKTNFHQNSNSSFQLQAKHKANEDFILPN
jgi:hypothetical protein